MVGIILASHGQFAEGILQASSMILGAQENVKVVTLQPSEGPDILRNKMQEAIATFENQEEVLFLVDLWGGTPFNQANILFEEHQDKWAIVAGMNLSMVIEAFSARFSSNSAQEIATSILPEAIGAIKTRPESLSVTTTVAAQPATTVTKGSLPPGTVVGSGKISYPLVRLDSRLLHGQVATAWTKATKPNRIIVVSDTVAKDELRKKLIEQAAPPGVKANVVPIKKMIEVAKDPRFGDTKALLLFETPQDVLTAVEGGVEIKELNIGSMAHSVGKVMVSKVLSMNQSDIDIFEKLSAKGVKFDVRKVPNDSPDNMQELIKKAQAELA